MSGEEQITVTLSVSKTGENRVIASTTRRSTAWGRYPDQMSIEELTRTVVEAHKKGVHE